MDGLPLRGTFRSTARTDCPSFRIDPAINEKEVKVTASAKDATQDGHNRDDSDGIRAPAGTGARRGPQLRSRCRNGCQESLSTARFLLR